MRIQEHLAEYGVESTTSSQLSDADMVIALGSVSAPELDDAFLRGAVILPAASLSIQKILSLVIAFVEPSTGLTPHHDSEFSGSDAGQRGVVRIDAVMESIEDAHLLERLAVFLSTTQHISAQLIQAGQMAACLAVCRHASHSLLDLLRASEADEEVADVLQAIAEAVSNALLDVEEGGLEPGPAVERLLDCFHQLSLGLQTASALMIIEETFEDLHTSGRDPSATLIHDVIKLTLTQCEALNEDMAFSWCGHVYLLVAKHLHQFLGSPRTNEESIITFARDQLAPFKDLEEDSLDLDAAAIVMALHMSLVDILKFAEDERPWAHDS